MSKQISILIKPASALCNLRCKYCFYANISSLREVRSYGRMKTDTVDQMIPNIYTDLNDGDTLNIAFQGGEPTVAGLRYFKYFVDKISQQTKRVTVNYSIQTNGIVINDQWCEFLKSNNFLVGLSIDGLPFYHNLNRVDTHGRGTFARVLATKHLLDHYHIEYNVLCVLTNELARHPHKVFHFLTQEHIRYVQFIPCLDDLDATTPSEYALQPNRFASFYNQIFSDWLANLQKGKYISIKLFDDIYNLFVRGQITACGITGHCQTQYIIEADGSVYPCDFFALDKYRLGYITQQTLKELFNQPISLDWHESRQTLPTYCDQCPFKRMCCGGCKRMKDAEYVTPTNDFCGYQSVLKCFLPHVDEITQLTRTAVMA